MNDNFQNGGTLQHHGILGQKWGVRRTESQLARNRQTIQEKPQLDITERNRNIKRAIIGTATVATAAYYVHKNPEAIGQVISAFRNVKVSELSKKAIDIGKTYVKESIFNAKEGMKEGMKEAPKKVAKAVVTGVVFNQTKRALDSAVGKEESARIFQANDNKKIGKFWKVSPDDKDDEVD